jgi:protocatechuate 3,4-dioxygenase beta subunit
MDRNEFLQILGCMPLLSACRKSDDPVTNGKETSTLNGSSPENCRITPFETIGPYPNKNPDEVVFTDIRGDREGVLMYIELSIKNFKNQCSPLEGAWVDVWQCDALGNYSQYGSFTSVNWLRGRQKTNAEGKVRFTSIFPGW